MIILYILSSTVTDSVVIPGCMTFPSDIRYFPSAVTQRAGPVDWSTAPQCETWSSGEQTIAEQLVVDHCCGFDDIAHINEAYFFNGTVETVGTSSSLLMYLTN